MRERWWFRRDDRVRSNGRGRERARRRRRGDGKTPLGCVGHGRSPLRCTNDGVMVNGGALVLVLFCIHVTVLDALAKGFGA
ncbi:hypothetical protein E2542_SST24625 [Spatholobus suberectus]|nr:hypothetical protein E2542_SST24625 [Spatholobus suberectus]